MDFIMKNIQGIIVAIMLIVIVEMIIPNNSNKKYIKIISGIYLIVTILNPFLQIIKKDFKIDIFDNLESIETSNSVLNLKKYYSSSLKQVIKKKLEDMGYKIEYVNIYFNDDCSDIEKLEIKCNSFGHIDEIREYLVKNYNLDSKIIYFL